MRVFLLFFMAFLLGIHATELLFYSKAVSYYKKRQGRRKLQTG